MDDEPFVKPGFNWKKQFTTVTPLSKYLAMGLFVILPFAGFVLGMRYEDVRVTKYEPIIVERVFEKEVIVESASTSTPEVKIIIFTGTVRQGGQNKCIEGGACSTLVSEYEVVWSDGSPDLNVGQKENVRPGDRVEVYGKVVGEKQVTLYGNENYYLKKVSSKEKSTEFKQRGDLLVLRSEGGLCIYGVCWSQITVFTDGSWEYEDGQGVFDEGTLEAGKVNEIITSVAATDFEVLKLTPFTDTCPAAVDGQKSVSTFYTELGLMTIDSCEIDTTSSPLFSETISNVKDEIYKAIAM